ncbi:phospholipid scramblase 1-like isoform X2 [Tigriopus californicus]|uniref:phospholipid scramblase 1-like isoform X2 n=1 Tax=Tigriopus californicus TaxID=6832 RepID=UPI0027DA2BAC|nr:phospholipid scramblase 1-like isoform X2 [Tigriopus californicus]
MLKSVKIDISKLQQIAMEAPIPGQANNPEQRVVTEQPKSLRNSTQDNRAISNPALEQLANSDKIVVQQLAGITEACCFCCDYEDENEFEIYDNFGAVILKAVEHSNCLTRQCCEQLRGFSMDIRDRQGNEIVRVVRPFRCNNIFCCPCFNQNMHIEYPKGNVIGSIEQRISLYPKYNVCDSKGDAIYTIEGPSACKRSCRRCCCSFWMKCCCCSRDIEFNILEDGEKVGVIAKRLAGPAEREARANSSERDRFGVDFPDEASLDMKIILTSVCFLIDYLYFEFDGVVDEVLG